MPLCLTYIDLKKAFDSLVTEVFVEVLDHQGSEQSVNHKEIRNFENCRVTSRPHFCHSTRMSSLTRREGSERDTIPPEISRATLEWSMQKLEWDDTGVKVGDQQLLHLRFADDIYRQSSGANAGRIR
ncbi:hypothetical protein RB195_015584 [Necator americanus]|uniref:Reverse transcriptase domain-containing protein n=1 Tax=Necator americanus TaxID=51031 RepID=A0ABR1E5C6_NECAM